MSDRQAATRSPDEQLSTRERTQLQSRGIPAEAVTGTGREVADKVKAWAKTLPRAR